MHSSDDEAADDDDEGDGFGRGRKYSSDEEQIEETADEKRLRLAKEYLARMKKDTDDADEEEVTDRAISSKLMQQAVRLRRRWLMQLALQYYVGDIDDDDDDNDVGDGCVVITTNSEKSLANI